MKLEMKYVIRVNEKCDLYFTDFENAAAALQMIKEDCYIMEINRKCGYFENMQMGRKDGEIYGFY